MYNIMAEKRQIMFGIMFIKQGFFSQPQKTLLGYMNTNLKHIFLVLTLFGIEIQT